VTTPLLRSVLAVLASIAPLTASAAVQALHDARQPAGPQAAHIHDLWLLMLWICAIAFVATMTALGLAVFRSRRGDGRTPADVTMSAGSERAPFLAVGTATAVTSLVMIGLLGASVMTDRALARLPLEDAVTIRLVGHQWWWEATYEDPNPSRVFSTANEIHVPVGRPVMLALSADDVIHSFWVPNLHGKKDLIPGHDATTQFRADVPGIYRGQCAEYCGYQHAKMALEVIAQTPADYERWAQAQRASPPPPSEPLAQRGQHVFMNTTCAMCHAIQGTDAGARRAPDLSHIASRRMLGAGELANDPAHLAAWISDPQAFKPGVNMPANPLATADMTALVAYLETLR
jgi:cytochrome c oxidase subunit 2